VNYPNVRDHNERFRTAIARQIGLRFEDGKLGFLDQVLRRRLKDRRQNCESYLWELEEKPPRAELLALARELTVGETYFFRNNEQFRALAEIVLPDRMHRRGGHGDLRLISAGCSSGEEAYSIAMTARESMAGPAWNVSIRAVDINPAALERARHGRYSAWALRETPPASMTRWFRHDGRDAVLVEAIRAMVNFEQANLAIDDPDLWPPEAYDAIFCRNVLMYFDPQQMQLAIARMARSLVPGGYLFLGHAETLRGVSDKFDLCHTHETFYYKLSDRAGSAQVLRFAPRQVAAPMPRVGDDLTWADDIRLASERVAALLPSPPALDALKRDAPVASDLAPVLALLRQERYGAALDCVRADTQVRSRSRDASLLEALLLVQNGQIAVAEDVIFRLLHTDQRHAPAHYVLGLCREHERAHERAVENHWAAAHFDPAFAMPRLHLGWLFRRNGDLEKAQREFRKAAVLLEQEQEARILMFGGGFSREALRALCESAMQECMRRSDGRPIACQ
jgi:chemotaxis protein methyltransferase CheR